MSERVDDLGINDMKVIQNINYFCFGTDSILLANFIESNSSKNVILDLCSGGGVIPLVIVSKKECGKIFGVELQEEMYDLLEKNIKYNKLEDTIFPIKEDIKNVELVRKNIINNTGTDKVDIIVSNPPYKKLGTGVLNEIDVKTIARHEIKCTLEDIFITSSKLVKNKGKLYLVHKPERLVDLLTLGRKYKFEAKRVQFVYPKLDLKPSMVLIEYVLNGGNELKILEPLIEYQSDGRYTEQYLKIYKSRKNKEGK